MSFPQRTTQNPAAYRLAQKPLPAVACESSRERKQQIKTVPFMMAARRTLIVTQTIYTAAGRLKGTWRKRGGAQRWASWQRGAGREVLVCRRCYKSHGMPQGRYEHEQLPFIFREAAAQALTSALVDMALGFSARLLILSAII